MENFTDESQDNSLVPQSEDTATIQTAPSDGNLFENTSITSTHSSETMDILSAGEDLEAPSNQPIDSNVDMDFANSDFEDIPPTVDTAEQALLSQPLAQHSTQQEELRYLNEEDSDGFSDANPIISMLEEKQWQESYAGIQEIDRLMENKPDAELIRLFDPKSLIDIQNIGIPIHQLLEDKSLKLLSNFIPVPVVLHPKGIGQDLVLLIEAHLYPDGLICLKPLPFVKNLPSIPLSEMQQRAIKAKTPFFMTKRVIDPLDSDAYEIKQQALWSELVDQEYLDQPDFEKLLETIRERPLEVEELVFEMNTSEEQTHLINQIIDTHFPVNLTLYTGITFVFIPLHLFDEIPRLQESFAQLLPVT